MSYFEVCEEILTPFDLQNLVRKTRAKSDFLVSYSMHGVKDQDSSNDSGSDSGDSLGLDSDAGALGWDHVCLDTEPWSNEDEGGKYDSEFWHLEGSNRCRLTTFDFYESGESPHSPPSIVPMMSEQRPAMIPMLSGQGSFGLVTATPSNPVMMTWCGPAPQITNVGTPVPTCTSTWEKVMTTPAPAALPANHDTPAPPASRPGCFTRNAENDCATHAWMSATTSPMGPPGCGGAGHQPSSALANTTAANHLKVQDDHRSCQPCFYHTRGKCQNDNCQFCHDAVHASRRKAKKKSRRRKEAQERS